MAVTAHVKTMLVLRRECNTFGVKKELTQKEGHKSLA